MVKLIWVLSVAAGLIAGAVVFLSCRNGPPKEDALLKQFQAHRSGFERLRSMIDADEQLLRVGTWGVDTIGSGISQPPEGDFPADRYNEYLALLKETDSLSVSRRPGGHAEGVSILLWATGWAGTTRHVYLCWQEHPPANQIQSLDDFYRTPKPRQPAFRHIDENWYLWADY